MIMDTFFLITKCKFVLNNIGSFNIFSRKYDASKNSVTTQENSKKCDLLPESDSR